MKAGEEAIEVDLRLNEAGFDVAVRQLLFLVNGAHVTEDVFVIIACVFALAVRYNGVHAKLSVLALLDHVGPHRRSHHVGHKGTTLGQVGSEVHLLPTVFLLNVVHSRKAEVLPNSSSSHEVDHAI